MPTAHRTPDDSASMIRLRSGAGACAGRPWRAGVSLRRHESLPDVRSFDALFAHPDIGLRLLDMPAAANADRVGFELPLAA